MSNRIAIYLVLLLLQACSFSDKPESFFSTSVQGIFSSAYSYDGRFSLVGSIQHGGSLWNTATSERLYNWNHQKNLNSQLTAVAFSPEGDFAVSAEENTLVLWSTHSGEAIRFFDAPGDILGLALSPNAETALLALPGGKAVVFDIQLGGLIHEMTQAGNILSMAMSADGRYGLFGLDSRKASYWDIGNATLVSEIDTQGRVQTVALSSDGSLGFISVQHIDAMIWNMKKDKLHSKLRYSNRFFPSFSSFLVGRFSPTGDSLITGNTTGAVELWHIADGHRKRRWITPVSTGLRTKIHSVVAVAIDTDSDHALAMTSNGTSYRYSLND